MVTRRIVAAVVGCLVAVAGGCRSPRAGQAAVSWRAEGVASAIVFEPPSGFRDLRRHHGRRRDPHRRRPAHPVTLIRQLGEIVMADGSDSDLKVRDRIDWVFAAAGWFDCLGRPATAR
jgi:hypothetical protein